MPYNVERRTMKPIPLSLLLPLITGAVAADDALMQEYLAPPTLAPAFGLEPAIEPDVTIIERGRDVIYEYRIRGQLYMVRVAPGIGPPYYLLDTNGDGILDIRSDRPWGMAVQQWRLLEW